MKESIKQFEFSAIVKNFNELILSLENTPFDAIFHAGMIPYDKKMLDKLCNDFKNNLTVYDDNGTSIYYFRFGKKEYYDDMPFALTIIELKDAIENIIHPKKFTKDEIERMLQKSYDSLATIYPKWN